jgi:uncharacterized protein (DUF488 family)
LRYLANAICNIDYLQLPDLTPTRVIERDYLESWGDWKIYEKNFFDLMAKRHVEEKISMEVLDHSCLLCSEAKPHHCHRSLVGEYLKAQWGDVEVLHL